MYSQVLHKNAAKFGRTKSYIEKSINLMAAENVLDRKYLYSLLSAQFFVTFDGKPIEGLTEILLKYIDIDFGPAGSPSTFCHILESYEMTWLVEELNKKSISIIPKLSPQDNNEAVSSIDNILSFGANINQVCEGGLTPAMILNKLVEEGVLKIKGSYLEHLLNDNKKVDDCLKLKGNIYLAELCLTVDVLNHYERNSNEFSKAMGKSSLGKVAILETVEGTNECSISFFDKMMSHAGKGVTKEVELRISHSKYKYDFTLSSSDKENFLREIKKLMKD